MDSAEKLDTSVHGKLRQHNELAICSTEFGHTQQVISTCLVPISCYDLSKGAQHVACARHDPSKSGNR